MDFANATAVDGTTQFRDDPRLKRYGLSDIPMEYSPPVTVESPLAFVQQDKAEGPDLARCWRQKEPARKLVAETQTTTTATWCRSRRRMG
jgi:hypothetical protein